MIRSHADDDAVPSPELLAAYADGELDRDPDLGPVKEQVERWLARHPEAAAELAVQAQLRRLCQETAPADPGDTAWDGVRVRILAGLSEPAAEPARRSAGRLLGWLAGGLGTAAAVLWLALTLWPRSEGPAPVAGPEPKQAKAPAVEPLAVATEDEVEIVEVQGSAADTLVVGTPPVQGDLVLVEKGDVSVTRVEPAPPDNMVPQVVLDGANPMIWSPLEAQRE
jgi:hypothetical protein